MNSHVSAVIRLLEQCHTPLHHRGFLAPGSQHISLVLTDYHVARGLGGEEVFSAGD